MTKKTKQRRDLYQEITDTVIASLEDNVIPWERPWFSAMSAPRSVSTGKLYRGSNALILGLQAYPSPWWVTFKQAKKLGGNVRKGEKSTVAVYWMFLDEKKNGEETGRRVPLLRHYNVFNITQCDLPQEVLDRLAARLDRLVGEREINDAIDNDAVTNAATVTNDYLTREGITLNRGGSSAFYHPRADAITMPEADTFRSPEAYAFTLLHECMHSTGHSTRLDRGLDTKLAAFGSETYSREELVAELGA
ncbi:MAG: ArdC-like ssDNA-binding domain-containing protein, partial [Pirellulaceae bacterium]|nr:ArdC-like ssDNA-binding domain-containing protein [Pirellulaceae bacterium]